MMPCEPRLSWDWGSGLIPDDRDPGQGRQQHLWIVSVGGIDSG